MSASESTLAAPATGADTTRASDAPAPSAPSRAHLAPVAVPAVARPVEPTSRRELFRLALNERADPEPFYTKLADRSIAEFPFPLRGRRVLDLGSGPGHYTGALARAGARVVPLDLGEANVRIAADAGRPVVRGDATRLPFPDAAFDGIFCSNMLEHVPSAASVIDEIERTLRPGGWAWISWTNWYSPWGGHDLTPYHLLGPRLGTRMFERVKGHGPERNAVFEGLWPTYIGRVLHDVRSRRELRVLDAVPRYYPSMRWVLKVPGLREVATWNCLIMLEKRRTAAPATSSAGGSR